MVLIAAAFQLGVIKEYQLDRLRAFIDRENTPADVRYNLDQAEIAVGSGGLFGQGYLHGRQTTLDYVPEQHTDFIFTVAGEEFGFVGAVFVLTLYALLLWRSIRIAFLSKDPFGTYLATGVAIMFAVQMFVNIGMVIGIMPITGIPLPFLSYGGQLDAGELHRGGDPAERAHAPLQVARRVARPPERRRRTGSSRPARGRPSRAGPCPRASRPRPSHARTSGPPSAPGPTP